MYDQPKLIIWKLMISNKTGYERCYCDDIRLRIRKTTVTITTTVITSVTVSGRDQNLIPHLSSRIRLWASRKIGLVSRHMWKAKDIAVKTGFSLILRLPKGISQKTIDLRDHLQLK
jgi:hypothetical protein